MKHTSARPADDINLQKAPDFENAEHEKAWLITVAANKCKDTTTLSEALKLLVLILGTICLNLQVTV